MLIGSEKPRLGEFKKLYCIVFQTLIDPLSCNAPKCA
jgi:hypothetical protein